MQSIYNFIIQNYLFAWTVGCKQANLTEIIGFMWKTSNHFDWLWMTTTKSWCFYTECNSYYTQYNNYFTSQGKPV